MTTKKSKTSKDARAWISKKIEKLDAEHKGRSQKQNVVIAFSMARKEGFKVKKK